jgi:hypothetical protein
MGQFAVYDQIAGRYAEEVERLVAGWDRGASACIVLLEDSDLRATVPPEAVTEQLRRAQYRAHLGAEVGNGLLAPGPLGDAHSALVDAFYTCRETLAVLAVRAELDELDDDTASYGVHAIRLVDEAFDGVRATAERAYAWHEDASSAGKQSVAPEQNSSLFNVMVWTLVGICAAIIVAVLVELVIAHV